MFRLTKIKIYPGCTGRKNLQEEEYVFVSEKSHKLPEGFYGKNIMVSAIVGKNGSGKSSILDIIYRVLNNLSAFLCTNLNSPSRHVFYFIKGVRAEIYYKDSHGNDCMLKCCDDTLWLRFFDNDNSEKKYRFGKAPEEEDDYTQISSLNDIERAKIMNHLFYCSVVNYAPFTQNSIEYEDEACAVVTDDLQIESNDLRRRNWMQAVFHKNDGYQSAITLTPFRDKGIFDAGKEAKLTRERLVSLLSVAPDLIEGYRFSDARFGSYKRRFAEKFRMTNPTPENGYNPTIDIDQFIGIFKQRLEEYKEFTKDSVAARILRKLGYKAEDIRVDDSRYVLAYLYLVYKVLSCARYPIFESYKDLNDTDLAIRGDDDRTLLDRVANLTREILAEHSHITFKLDRVLNYISAIDRLHNDDYASSVKFNLTDYFMVTGHDKQSNLIITTRDLPPSYFDMEILLKPEGNETDIPFEQLSSGERLFYVTISSIIYHAMNLISVPDQRGRVKYRNMLVVLDESEICFHPEYQRTFLNKLIGVIKRLGFNRYLNIHILLTTHSPFILSDIPISNILFLKDGRSVDSKEEKIINPYGANINDILCQSFFLEKDGFIGEHARQTILSLYDFLDDRQVRHTQYSDIQWDQPLAKRIIDLIGEPLIRESLLSLYRRKYRNREELLRQIEELNGELRKLDNEQ